MSTGHDAGPRPLVGVIACNRSVGGDIAANVAHRYLRPLARHAAVSTVIVPSIPKIVDAARLARQLDGLMLTGSPSNVDPTRYGEADDDPGPLDRERDEMTNLLLSAMIEAGKPVLGICRGLQEINVHLGGSLDRRISEVESRLAHHAAADSDFAALFGHGHEVKLAPGSVLRDAIGTDNIRVNSVHYQGIARIAPGLAAEAMAPDGVVEAVSGWFGRAFVLAVQWHPEWDADHHPAARAVFTIFGRAVRGEIPRPAANT